MGTADRPHLDGTTGDFAFVAVRTERTRTGTRVAAFGVEVGPPEFVSVQAESGGSASSADRVRDGDRVWLPVAADADVALTMRAADGRVVATALLPRA